MKSTRPAESRFRTIRLFRGSWAVAAILGFTGLLRPAIAQEQIAPSSATTPSTSPYIRISVVDGLLHASRMNPWIEVGKQTIIKTDGNLGMYTARSSDYSQMFSLGRHTPETDCRVVVSPGELFIEQTDADRSAPYRIIVLNQFYSNVFGEYEDWPVVSLTVGLVIPLNPAPIRPVINQVEVHIAATSFEDLCREHPAEVELYVRPMFTSLNLDQLLDPSDVEMTQVFSEAVLDAAKMARVKDLVAQLDSDSSAVREKASDELVSLHSTGVIAMLRTDKSTLSPEQLTRIENFCRGSRLLSADEIAGRRRDPAFLAQCLMRGSRPIRLAALAALKDVLHRDVSFNVDASLHDRAQALRSLRRSPATRQ